jgi:hypothetical protein
MSNEYGYIPEAPSQLARNSGVFSANDVVGLETNLSFGGKLELIQKQSVSSVTDVTFTNIKGEQYETHYITIDAEHDTHATAFVLRFYESGVERTSDYAYAHKYGDDNNLFSQYTSQGTGTMVVALSTTNTSTAGSGIELYLHKLHNPNIYSFMTSVSHNLSDSTTGRFTYGGGVLMSFSTVDQIKIFMNDGTSTFSGNINLYGVIE